MKESLETKQIAKSLLEIGAVALSPEDPFVWSSGIHSPIYCDNRLTMSYPKVRKQIAAGLAQLIDQHYPHVQCVAGTATAGIPHAAWVADQMDVPMIYVRTKSKDHGKGNQIEGKVEPGQKVVVVEDLISTGGSSLQAAQALRAAQVEVLGVVAIFTYELETAAQAFKEKELTYYTLSHYSSLIQVAEENNLLTESELCKLKIEKP